MIDLSKLRPGDCLLYGRTPFKTSPIGWFFGLIINIKTWSRFCHVEIYAGSGKAFASRDGKGVGLYPFREAQLIKVRRPDPEKYDHERALEWFAHVDGQKYDFVGLLGFGLNRTKKALQAFLRIAAASMQFCSEFGDRWYIKAGVYLFNKEIDPEMIAPAQFDQVPFPQMTTVHGWRVK